VSEQNDDDVVVSQKDIDNVTKEVLDRDKVEQDKIRKEVETQVRKEILEEQTKQKLVDDKQKLEAALVQKEKEKVTEQETLRKEVNDLKEQMGQSKAQINTDNPFLGKKPTEQELNIDNLTPEQIMEIDENSKKAFKESLSGRGGKGSEFTRW
jgi:hypothetical protein